VSSAPQKCKKRNVENAGIRLVRKCEIVFRGFSSRFGMRFFSRERIVMPTDLQLGLLIALEHVWTRMIVAFRDDHQRCRIF
jgi:hypothetical protein